MFVCSIKCDSLLKLEFNRIDTDTDTDVDIRDAPIV